MRLSLDRERLAGVVGAQVSSLIPDRAIGAATFQPFVDAALERVEYCFARLNVKHFSVDGEPSFSHLHTDQYCIFLYLLSNTIFKQNGPAELAAKVYALNKALHGIDVFYEVELPPVFGVQHPVGTVLGRATYGNYFFVYQRCSIGSNTEGAAPVLGEGVVMFGSSAVLGDSTIGPNCWLSFGTTLMNTSVPANSVVFGQPPQNVVKATERDVVSHFFRR